VKLAWVTDIHLNFIGPEEVDAFTRAIAAAGPDVVLVAGDIAEAPTVEGHLLTLARALGRPIYFVLGNHDFYFGGIAEVRAAVDTLPARSPWLRWLNTAGVVELSPRTALVGHDGWGDGRLGSGSRSRVMLNDFVVIRDLTGLPAGERFTRLGALGDEAAAHVRATLPAALARYEHVVFLTHVPPFAEACWHDGKTSGDDWLPYFTCKAVGDALVEAATARPDRNLTVLCGHTHGAGRAQILPNLEVLTGAAEYGAPEVQPVLEVD
jgi:3',5'-cyclic AMP phosphodiesterase CpdA